MKLTTRIIAIVLLFTYIEVTDGTLYRMLNWHNKDHEIGYGCWKSNCWAYCGVSWVSSSLFDYCSFFMNVIIPIFKLVFNFSIRKQCRRKHFFFLYCFFWGISIVFFLIILAIFDLFRPNSPKLI